MKTRIFNKSWFAALGVAGLVLASNVHANELSMQQNIENVLNSQKRMTAQAMTKQLQQSVKLQAQQMLFTVASANNELQLANLNKKQTNNSESE